MATNTSVPDSSDIRIKSAILSRIPILDGPLINTQRIATSDPGSWKDTDKKLMGYLAITISDSLAESNIHVTHSSYTVTSGTGTTTTITTHYQSMTYKVWKTMLNHFTSRGIAGQFFYLYKVFHHCIHPSHASEDLNTMLTYYQSAAQAGMNLPESLWAMFMLAQLPDDFEGLHLTLIHVTEAKDFTVDNIQQAIL